MNVIIFAVKLYQLRFEVIAHSFKYFFQSPQDGFGEHAATIFGNENQMHVQFGNAVTAGSNFICVIHRPSIY
jgi:hypothetical protein